MKKDMGGAACALATAQMLRMLDVGIELRVLIPAVENSVDGAAFRPGDVCRSRKGLTVEIGNTDAEGRLVLADALAFASEETARPLIDLATLTGAARVALGAELPPVYGGDAQLVAELREAGHWLRRSAVADAVVGWLRGRAFQSHCRYQQRACRRHGRFRDGRAVPAALRDGSAALAASRHLRLESAKSGRAGPWAPKPRASVPS